MQVVQQQGCRDGCLATVSSKVFRRLTVPDGRHVGCLHGWMSLGQQSANNTSQKVATASTGKDRAAKTIHVELLPVGNPSQWSLEQGRYIVNLGILPGNLRAYILGVTSS